MQFLNSLDRMMCQYEINQRALATYIIELYQLKLESLITWESFPRQFLSTILE
jgi:hypothetical protein